MIVDGATSTLRSCIISVKSRYEIPYLQYQRTQTRMISTGKRRRLNMTHRSAHELSVPVNATVPEKELGTLRPTSRWPLQTGCSQPA